MATKWCLNCRSEFLASIEVCPDCGVDLVDEEPVERFRGESGASGQRGGNVVYELHEWAIESRVLLEQFIEAQQILHAWEGTDLVVAPESKDAIDTLVAQVEATTLPTLDPDAPKIVYEMGEWSDAEVTRLAEGLLAVEIHHEFDYEGNLVVLEEDEQRVEDLLDSIEFPDALSPDMDDDAASGPDTQEVLSDLFVAVDRLRKHARDHEGVLGLIKTAATVTDLPVPFGFAPAVWNDIKGQATRLREAIENDSASDEEIEAQADEFRTLLRSYV